MNEAQIFKNLKDIQFDETFGREKSIGVIYAVEYGDLVKIGCTRNPKIRCTRCHSDITSDRIGEPVLITYDGDNIEYICPDCTVDFFFYSLGKTLEALNCDPVTTEQDEEDRKERMKNAEIPL